MQSDMCEVRIFNENFEWQGVVKTAESVILNRKHKEIDQFQIYIHPDKKNAYSFLESDNYVVFNGDYSKVGIIRDKRIEEDREGAVIIASGEGADGIFKQRTIVPPTKDEAPDAYGYDLIKGPAETVLKHYINRHLINPTDKNRKVEFLELENDFKRGKEFPWRSRYTQLSDEIKEICDYGDIGYKYYFDTETKKIRFSYNEGVDRTINQTENPPVVFRMSNKSIGSYRYSEDYSNYKTTGICGGAGEDENRLIYTLGTEYKGKDRYEVFLDCGNVDIEELVYYGQQKLNEYIAVVALQADALPRNYIFEKDFFLGDKVTCIIDRLNLELDLRVTNVVETWEKEVGYAYEIIFGDDIPNLLTQIKQKTQKEVR